jgi:hypothetical protein
VEVHRSLRFTAKELTGGILKDLLRMVGWGKHSGFYKGMQRVRRSAEIVADVTYVEPDSVILRDAMKSLKEDLAVLNREESPTTIVEDLESPPL